MIGVIKIVLGVTVVSYAILLALLLKERPSPLRTLFCAYVGCVAAWTFFIFLNTWLASASVAHWVFAFAALFLTAQVWFAKLFPDGTLPKKWWEYWSVAIGCCFFAVSFIPGALFASISFSANGYVEVANGSFSMPYSLFAVVYTAAPIYFFLSKRRSAHDLMMRAQLLYLSVGFSLFLIVSVLTNSVLPVFFKVYLFNVAGPVSSLVLAITAFYVIWRYRFLDMRAVVQRSFVYSLLFALIVATYGGALFVIQTAFALETALAAPVGAGIVMLVGIYTVPLIEKYFRRMTDRIFFKDRYDYALALQSLGEILATSTDFDELVRRIQTSLADIFRAESVEIQLRPRAGAPSDPRTPFASALEEHRQLYEPIRLDADEIGAILVREKRSGDRYSAEDVQLLRTFSLQASTALARAQLFRQVQEYALELEQKVGERTEELRRSREREKQMMVDISHNLLTPLAVFQTKLERMKRTAPADAQMSSMERSLGNLSHFIEALLRLSRLESPDAEMEMMPLDLGVLLLELAEEIGTIASAHGITLRTSFAHGIYVRGDAQRLREVVMNLASNAVKYMRPGGTREITLSLSRVRTSAIITVEDTGIGIRAKDLRRIFERYYCAGGAVSQTGTGLGLAIAKSIVERHEGTIAARSTYGTGTTMVIRLPVIAEPSPRP